MYPNKFVFLSRLIVSSYQIKKKKKNAYLWFIHNSLIFFGISFIVTSAEPRYLKLNIYGYLNFFFFILININFKKSHALRWRRRLGVIAPHNHLHTRSMIHDYYQKRKTDAFRFFFYYFFSLNRQNIRHLKLPWDIALGGGSSL